MPYILLLLTSFLFGGNFVFGKALVGHASPMTLTSLRWIIAVICLLPIVWRKEKNILPPKSALIPLLLMGLTGVVIFNLLQFAALERTSATNVGLISTLNTISIAFFSFVFLKEKINALQITAILLSLYGVLFVLTKGDIHEVLSFQFNIGDLFMMAAVCIWGIYSVCSRWAMKTVSPLMATFYSGLFGVIVLFPFNAADFTIHHINEPFMLAILYNGIVSTVVCMLLWNIGVQKVGATTAGLFLNFNPIFTAILAFVLLGELMSWRQGIGSMIIILGCYLFTYFKSGKYLHKKSRAMMKGM